MLMHRFERCTLLKWHKPLKRDSITLALFIHQPTFIRLFIRYCGFSNGKIVKKLVDLKEFGVFVSRECCRGMNDFEMEVLIGESVQWFGRFKKK